MVYNVFVPNFIITARLASYGEAADDLMGRLQVTVTVLLALTTFKFVVANKLHLTSIMQQSSTATCFPLLCLPSP